MEIVIKIPMTDVLFIKDKTHCSGECYELTSPVFGCNFLFANCNYNDDLGGEPYIEIGYFEDNKFISRIHGYSDAIDEDTIGFGGIYIEVYVVRPDLSLELKTR